MDLTNLKIAHTTEVIEKDFLGVTLKLARGNNAVFKAKFEALTKPYASRLKNRDIDEEVSAELLAEALAGTVLVGWSGFLVEGEELEFSEEAAKALLFNDDDCREFVINVSKDFTMFLRDQEDAVVKK